MIGFYWVDEFFVIDREIFFDNVVGFCILFNGNMEGFM